MIPLLVHKILPYDAFCDVHKEEMGILVVGFAIAEYLILKLLILQTS